MGTGAVGEKKEAENIGMLQDGSEVAVSKLVTTLIHCIIPIPTETIHAIFSPSNGKRGRDGR